MKLFVLGATGRTGHQIVSEGLAAGHTVVAIVRSPDKISLKHDNLSVIKEDMYDSTKLVEHLRGCDAVLSAIGSAGGMFNPCTTYTAIGKAVITAMRETGVNRFLCVSSWGTKYDSGLPYFFQIFRVTYIRNLVSDMAAFEDYLMEECKDINYTVVRPSRLLDSPSKGVQLHISEGQVTKDYNCAEISRQDVAKFMLQCLTNQEYDQKMIAITWP